jgi:hypothetical protein
MRQPQMAMRVPDAHVILKPNQRQTSNSRTHELCNLSYGNRKEKEAGQVFPPPLVSRFREMPASLTEGGQPVVCWPGYETRVVAKKFRAGRKNK